jgi:hypothetical protein
MRLVSGLVLILIFAGKLIALPFSSGSPDLQIMPCENY